MHVPPFQVKFCIGIYSTLYWFICMSVHLCSFVWSIYEHPYRRVQFHSLITYQVLYSRSSVAHPFSQLISLYVLLCFWEGGRGKCWNLDILAICPKWPKFGPKFSSKPEQSNSLGYEFLGTTLHYVLIFENILCICLRPEKCKNFSY